MAKRNIFRGLAAVLALGMCMTGLHLQMKQ